MRNTKTTELSRRHWLKLTGAAALGWMSSAELVASSRGVRRFHVCLAPPLVVNDPELLQVVRAAGVGTVWLAGYFYGHRPYSDDLIQRARVAVMKAGMDSQCITVPLGHPGDSLGARDGDFPLTPPPHWHMGQRPDGRTYAGTSLHAPATVENVTALRHLRGFGYRQCFVDDDFRLARGPGEIGGCFCAEHRRAFLRAGSYAEARWDELRDDVAQRRLTPLLRAWVDFTCDELTASFRAQARAFGAEFGNMVMYLGAEKAGIRLRDYRHDLLRVGELMFDDRSFGSVKGKTDELFSVLFHRRYVRPECAFSETTAYPSDRLSAANMAAKLVISTVADVRQTMFMSGLTPFPRTHWSVLGPAMRRQAEIHAELAGHRLRGPLRHYWGEAERLVGDDRPFSLWLALGIPFEVVEHPAADGWTFLADFDARAAASRAKGSQGRWVCRPSATRGPEDAEPLEENLESLFAWKNRVRPLLRGIPYVEDSEPAVCAWYPSANRVLVWNLAERERQLTLAFGNRRIPVSLGPLQAELIPLG